jgi:putative addiction module component (TIGR02574 family)
MAIDTELVQQTLRLPADDRAELARQLLLSLEGAKTDLQIGDEREAEIERRLTAAENSPVPPIDWEESISRARTALDTREAQ